jgi:hypothetical protein
MIGHKHTHEAFSGNRKGSGGRFLAHCNGKASQFSNALTLKLSVHVLQDQSRILYS